MSRAVHLMGPGGMRSLMSSSHQQSDPFSRNRARDSGGEYEEKIITKAEKVLMESMREERVVQQTMTRKEFNIRRGKGVGDFVYDRK